MSTRYNTGNPIESTDVRDMSDNAKNFDEFSTSTNPTFTDRLGVSRSTLPSLISRAESDIYYAVINAGFQPSPFDFVTGGTLVSGDRNKAVFNPSPSGDNNWYAWQGSLPKTITPNSTPATSGGLGGSAWKPVTNNVLAPTVRESIKRSYANAGYNLVYGSFEVGGTLNNASEVLLQESSGKAFGWAGAFPKVVAAGSDVTGFVDKSPLQAGAGVVRNDRFALRDFVSVKDFGAVGDGVTDDTAKIMAALVLSDAHVFFPDGNYAVTTMTWSFSNKRIVFSGGAYLSGVSQVPCDQILELRNFRHNKIINLQIKSDGDAVSPIYMQNYGCALRITSTSGSSPSQFFTIDGLYVRYVKAGLVSGNLLGQPAQPSYPQSEIFISDYKVRGVMQQFYQNAINSYITTTKCVYVTQKFEASDSWWRDEDAFNLRSDITTGAVVSVGDEFQAARASGYNIYGSNIYITDPVLEQSCKNYITGNVRIRGVANGYFGNGNEPPFLVATNTKGRLLLDDVGLRRPSGTASSSRSNFVDAIGSPEYQVDIINSVVKEFAYTANAADALFVRGCKAFYDNLSIDNSASTASSWEFKGQSTVNFAFDGSGESMAATIDTSTKGGWTYSGSTGGFGLQTSGGPQAGSGFIRITTVGSTAGINSPTGVNAMRIVSGKPLLLSAILKRLGEVSNFTIKFRFFDFSGAELSSSSVFAAVGSRLTANGFDNWQPFSVPVLPPRSACYASLLMQLGNNADIGITSIIVSQ